jgi:uncharacterized protein
MRALPVLALLALLLVGCADETGGTGGAAERPDTGPSQPTTSSDAQTTATSRDTMNLSVVTIDASGGERVEVRVEIADNPIGRIIGLRYREHLPEDQGMLFVYTEEERRSFTMEDTLIPLSIAFMDSSGRIVDMQDMKPQTVGYVSAEPAQYALEVNRGFFEDRGVEVGDRAELPV